MIIKASTVQKIVQGKPRSYLLIENLTNSTVYISNREYPDNGDYSNNSIAIKKDGLLEINPCVYQGDFFGFSTTESDIRVLEL